MDVSVDSDEAFNSVSTAVRVDMSLMKSNGLRLRRDGVEGMGIFTTISIISMCSET